MKLLWRESICKYSEGERCTFYNFYEKPFLSGDKAVWFHDFLTETYENVFSASVFDLKSGVHERFSIKFKKGKGVPVAHCWKITERDGGYFIDPYRYYRVIPSMVAVMKDGKLEFVPKKEEDTRVRTCLFFDGKTIEKTPPSAVTANKMYSDQKVFEFGNLRVKIAKNATRKLECTNLETGKTLWTFTFIGYLYTDVFEYDGIIYFGTAGQGGRFYGLNLLSGEVLHEINTHGTTRFTRHNGKFYFPAAGGELQEYDPESKTSQYLSFGKNTRAIDEVSMLVANGNLYAVVTEKILKNHEAYDFSLACVQI